MPTETFKQYQSRILGYLGKKNPTKVLQATPARLKRLISGIPRKKLTRRPVPGKWSLIEILVHLCDTELAFGWRIRMMLTRPGVPLQWFDQDRWTKDFRYDRYSATDALVQFRILRKSNLNLLRAVPRTKWKTGYGIHELRGRQTVADFVAMEAGHDLNHLLQIRKILR
jgi:hypothetical protein